MKKFILIATTASIITSSALAKTEGNYVGIDLVRSSAKVTSNSTSQIDQSFLSNWYNHKKTDSAYGFGINYKYAFNFNGFYVAPGVSYTMLNNDVKVSYSSGIVNDSYSQSMKLKSQLTFQTNFGYDITDQFSAYVPVGISSFNYQLKTVDNGFSGDVVANKSSGYKTAAFIGFGVAYEPIKNWVLNLEYNKFQNFKTNTSYVATINGGRISTKTNVDVVKLGLSYKF
ncbi:MAG: outer membrane beta-barrel protein [Rickettsiales bacterium]|nr:outer membrane beta-barrel protein [Rickettsiales bacterium]